VRSDHPEGLRTKRGLAVQNDTRRLITFANDFHVAESKPFGPTGPEGLEASLFRSKPRRQRQNPIRPQIACGPFAVCENPLDEMVPVTTDRVRQPPDLDDIDSQPHDHAASKTRLPAGKRHPGGILNVPRRSGLVSEIVYSQ